jgi:hypothetical protein
MNTIQFKNPRIDAIYRQPDGTYEDQSGRKLKVREVFKSGRLYCFSGQDHPLLVAEWNVNGAMFFVIGDYSRRWANTLTA